MVYPIRIDRPLDFAAVTDHSEYLGAARLNDAQVLPLETRSLRERLLHSGPLSLTYAFLRSVANVSGLDVYTRTPEIDAIGREAWLLMVDTAERHYEPGVFSTLLGYEWTSMPDGQNLHRNVIYRDTNVPDLPYSSVESLDPRDLWDALDAQRAEGKVMLAIPHNANVSNGLMYARGQYDGSPIDAAYAEQRVRNEPISEILQIKGTSDTHPLLSPEDEFADFEIYDAQLSLSGAASNPAGSYARDALRTGIEFAHSEGFNPYRFGVIGSSDSHNASSSVEESTHHGKLPLMDGTAALRLGKAMLLTGSLNRPSQWGAAGLAAVWAEENTRESVYDALARRETYATSGPRMSLRFFASFDYEQNLLDQPDLLQRAYALGVPMGGVLNVTSATRRAAPVFALWAQKDPRGANLDRLQVIKGWTGDDGVSRETIYDVALSGGREPGAGGAVEPVGNTVDATTATYSNTIGATELRALWRDPDFDPAQEAFYYARVLEIPTPRWSTFDALRLGIAPPEPASLQERAISSAIFFEPGGAPGR